MPKRLSSRQIVDILHSYGFVLISQKGSHQKYRNSDGRVAIVPAGRKIIPTGTTMSIIRQSGLPRAAFD